MYVVFVVSKSTDQTHNGCTVVHESDHIGAERTMSKHRAFFCSTFVHVSGQDEKKGHREADFRCYTPTCLNAG